MPKALWKGIHNIVQKVVTKTITKKKKCKKAKGLSEEGFQISGKRSESQRKKKRETYTLLNAEFQRIARRDKKAFLSEQHKETEKNNRMRKKIRDTKGAFHAKMDTIKERNGKDLTEAEEIKKRGQEYREKLYKKVFMTQRTTTVWSLT